MEIDKRFSEVFIEKIKHSTSYAFLIINREGIIIAATEKERIGLFHEASYLMMCNNLDMIIVRPEEVTDYLGAKPGIDVPIVIDGETIGALGITGFCDEVKPIVTVVKMTIESMLEYERLKETTSKKNSDREAFFNLLITGGMRDKHQLTAMAQRLGYQPNAMRVGIVFSVQAATQGTVAQITGSENFTSQDFAFINKDGEIVVFHRIGGKPEQLMDVFRQSVEDFLDPIRKEFDRFGIKYRYYVGSAQNSFNSYSYSYGHCIWLRDNCRHGDFFYDYVGRYIKTLVPILELNGIYQSILSLFDDEMIESYGELIGVLERNNYNLVASSKELYIHKNTLIFRLNKIRDFLGLNPVQDAGDRMFMDYLSFYIEMQYNNVLK